MLVGAEADSGGGGGRRCRGSGARGDEMVLQGGSPGDGDHVCVLEEARGGEGLPESSPESRRTQDGAEKNLLMIY